MDVLRKRLNFLSEPSPGVWWGFDAPLGCCAVYCCPVCGIEASLIGHRIDCGGSVIPSCACPNCKYVADFKLAGWCGVEYAGNRVRARRQR